MKNFDIDTIAACNEGAEIELTHPTTNQPTGVFVKVVGKDSDLFQRLISESADAERLRQWNAQKRGKTAPPRLYAETQAEAVAMLATATIGWRTVERNAKGEVTDSKNVVALDGEELSFSEANAIKFYTKRPAFKQQIDEAIANLENFIKG